MSATDDALRQAARRLLDGASLRTAGALTIQNLAREAGVGRATVYRSVVLGEFRDAVAHRDTHQPGIAGLQNQIRELKAELAQSRRRHAEEAGELRADRSRLLQLVQVLTLERDKLLRHQHSSAPLTPLTPRRQT